MKVADLVLDFFTFSWTKHRTNVAYLLLNLHVFRGYQELLFRFYVRLILWNPFPKLYGTQSIGRIELNQVSNYCSKYLWILCLVLPLVNQLCSKYHVYTWWVDVVNQWWIFKYTRSDNSQSNCKNLWFLVLSNLNRSFLNLTQVLWGQESNLFSNKLFETGFFLRVGIQTSHLYFTLFVNKHILRSDITHSFT